MKKFIMAISLFLAHGLSAFYDAPACFEQLETDFFQYSSVGQALSLHNVDQNQWAMIVRRLKERSQGLPKIIREEANKLPRDPLDHPFQAKEAQELLEKELFNIFNQVLYESNVVNKSDIKGMFAYIRHQQADRLKACFGENKANTK